MRNNKIIVIVGPTGAVGSGAAKFFASQESYSRVILVGRSKQKIDALREQIPEWDKKVEVVDGCDVRQVEQVRQAFTKVKALVNDEPLDTVVFSIVSPTKFHDVDDLLESIDASSLMEGQQIKVAGALNVLKAFAPAMRKNGTMFITNGGAGIVSIYPLFSETGIVSRTLQSLVNHLSGHIRDKYGALITSVAIAGAVKDDALPSSMIAQKLFDWGERNFTNPDAWKDEEEIIQRAEWIK